MIAIATIALSKAPLLYIAFLYGLGGLIFVSAILGCCGICQENVCLTVTVSGRIPSTNSRLIN